jgi:hypothetical protein
MAFLLSRIGLVRPRSEMIKIKSNQISVHCTCKVLTGQPNQARHSVRAESSKSTADPKIQLGAASNCAMRTIF